MKLFSIALHGLLGRKKDTRLLLLAVILTFLFLTMSTTVLSSMDHSEKEQRALLYGDWQVAAQGLTGEEADRLQSVLPAVRCQIRGADDRYGTIGVFTDDLAEMGNFKLIDGRFPEKDDEVLLESSQLLALKDDVQVGDTISVCCTVKLSVSPEGRRVNASLREQAEEDNRQRLENLRQELAEGEELTQYVDEILNAASSLQQMRLNNYKINYDSALEHDFYIDRSGSLYTYSEFLNLYGLGEETRGKHFYELSEEEKKTLIRGMAAEDLAPARADTVDLTSSSYRKLLGCRDMSVRADVVGIKEIGSYDSVTVTVQKDCVLTGIIETYTDLWNVGEGQLANLYVMPDRAAAYEEAFAAVYEEYPYLERYDASEDLLFFRDLEETPEELFLQVMPEYNQILSEREQRYDVQYTQESGLVEYGFLMEDEQTGAVSRFVGSYSVTDPEVTLTVNPSGEGGGQTITLSQSQLLTGDFTLPLYQPPAPHQAAVEDMDSGLTGNLRINRFAYPLDDSGAYRQRLIMAVLFVTASAAVLQIFLTQIRKRVRRIALLKALGTTNRQIAGMLVYEFLFYLAVSLPAGMLLGLLGARMALLLLGRARSLSSPYSFFVQPGVLLAGVAAGTFALLFGMAVPGVKALQVPLSGRMELPGPRSRHARTKTGRRMTFPALIRRSLAVNRGRTLGNLLLASLIGILAVLCTYVGYVSFDTYRTSVTWADRPDYVLTLPRAVNEKSGAKITGELNGLDGVIRTDQINAGLNIPFAYDNMEESPLVQEMHLVTGGLSEQASEGLLGELEEGEQTFRTDLYSLDADSPLFQRLMAQAEGQLDPQAYAAGEEAVLFVPVYRIQTEKRLSPIREEILEHVEKQDQMKTLLEAGGRTTLSARLWMRRAGQTEKTVQPGSTVRFLYEKISMGSAGYQEEKGIDSVKISAVVSVFGDQGLYPLTEHMRGFTLIGSDELLLKAYPYSVSPYSYSLMSAFLNGANDVFYQDSMGRTYFQVYTDPKAAGEKTDQQVAAYARDHAMELTSYRESSQKTYLAAQQNMLLAALLGFAAVVLTALILDNTVASGLEADRRRMGILQSFGVTKGKFLLQQLYVGAAAAAVSLLAAHVVWLASVCLFTLLAGGKAIVDAESFFACLADQALWNYPWKIHAAICAGCVLLNLILQILPMVRLLKYKPMENIMQR